MRKLFMAVTNDEYELPLCPPSSAERVAQMLGIQPKSVKRMSFREKKDNQVKRTPYRVIGIWSDE